MRRSDLAIIACQNEIMQRHLAEPLVRRRPQLQRGMEILIYPVEHISRNLSTIVFGLSNKTATGDPAVMHQVIAHILEVRLLLSQLR